MSTIVWYGCCPEPAHRPHTSWPVAPVPLQGPGRPRPFAARRDESSGARSRTLLPPHGAGKRRNLAGPADNARVRRVQEVADTGDARLNGPLAGVAEAEHQLRRPGRVVRAPGAHPV